MPVTVSTAAVVLKTIDYSDTSLIVRLFTAEQGKVTVMAKGARRIKSEWHGILQPPNHLDLVYRYKESRDIQNLTKGEFAERYSNIAGDMVRTGGAFLAVEMLDRAVHEADPQPVIFRLITAFLRALDGGLISPEILLHFYELHLSRQLGFAPHLQTCQQCGRPLTEAALEPMSGDLSCTQCYQGTEVRLGATTLDYLKWLSKQHISKLGEREIASEAQNEADRFLLKYLFAHVEGMDKLKALKFWQQVSR